MGEKWRIVERGKNRKWTHKYTRAKGNVEGKSKREKQGEKLKRGETDSKRRGKRGMKEYRRGNEEKKI